MTTKPINHHGVMSQRDVAARMNVSLRRIQQLEARAFRKLRAEIVRQAQASGMSVRDWINGV